MTPDIARFHEVIRWEHSITDPVQDRYRRETLAEIISDTDGLYRYEDILWYLEVSRGRIANKIVGDDIDHAENIDAVVTVTFDWVRDLIPDDYEDTKQSILERFT